MSAHLKSVAAGDLVNADRADDLIALTSGRIAELLKPRYHALTEFRRDLHQHPELSNQEYLTTQKIIEALRSTGLKPKALGGTGVVCDVGSGPIALALRGDIDALPVPDRTTTTFRSVNPGVAHACGHDVHATALLGTGQVLEDLHQQLSGGLGGTIRLIFQPAEEVTPGGAISVIDQGALDEVPRILALHCDPNLDVGKVGTRIGAITAAGDTVRVVLRGKGGHTSRPHLTQDLVFALAQVATQVPTALARLIDARHSVSLVWGTISSGVAPNVVPGSGSLSGTLRCLDVDGWHQAAELLPTIVEQIAGPYGVEVELDHKRGVPPVVNTEIEMGLMEAAIREELGANSIVLTPQSMGGEDFAWYLTHVPGAMARLGTRTPGGTTYDIHQGDYEVDERALGYGIRVLTASALKALEERP
ncbi:amidohydrolase [Saxibacter everestensis]|uniref:Amidohydrolase n=1 Tax=Saxibacter everestensis TaxID=2909229 RepID=A0ABY8QR45_9MICO|nr:amidohydrolase [Brevibacteriaceae bacterium ZFBP1038]